jgi:phage FluMu protein Com
VSDARSDARYELRCVRCGAVLAFAVMGTIVAHGRAVRCAHVEIKCTNNRCKNINRFDVLPAPDEMPLDNYAVRADDTG